MSSEGLKKPSVCYKAEPFMTWVFLLLSDKYASLLVFSLLSAPTI